MLAWGSPASSRRRSRRSTRRSRAGAAFPTGRGSRIGLWSSTWRSSPRARRSCSSAWRGRSCSSVAPQWPVALRLEPLAPDDVDELIPPTVEPELRERIARAAGGNPLFITEMLAMTGDAEADIVVPPTLQALLTARLDQLAPPERGVLERGAVEGEIFHRGARFRRSRPKRRR